MDNMKNPGIKFGSIALTECKFDRVPDFPKSVSLNLQFNYAKGKPEKQSISILTLNLAAIDDNNKLALTLNCSFAGHFSIDSDQPNMPMQDFLDNNAPAILFPYIRQFVTDITSRAGIPPIILPPMNIHAMLAKAKPVEVLDKIAEETPKLK